MKKIFLVLLLPIFLMGCELDCKEGEEGCNQSNNNVIEESSDSNTETSEETGNVTEDNSDSNTETSEETGDAQIGLSDKSRLESVEIKETGSNDNITLNFTYDNKNGNLKTIKQNDQEIVTQIVYDEENQDEENQLEKWELQDGKEIIFNYDAKNRIDSISKNDENKTLEKILIFEYDENDKLEKIEYRNKIGASIGMTTYSYDDKNLNQLKSTKYTEYNNYEKESQYSYDNKGNIKKGTLTIKKSDQETVDKIIEYQWDKGNFNLGKGVPQEWFFTEIDQLIDL